MNTSTQNVYRWARSKAKVTGLHRVKVPDSSLVDNICPKIKVHSFACVWQKFLLKEIWKHLCYRWVRRVHCTTSGTSTMPRANTRGDVQMKIPGNFQKKCARAYRKQQNTTSKCSCCSLHFGGARSKFKVVIYQLTKIHVTTVTYCIRRNFHAYLLHSFL